MDTSAFDCAATLAEFCDEARNNLTTVERRLHEARAHTTNGSKIADDGTSKNPSAQPTGLERAGLDRAGLDELFRGAHSLKGLAGMFNLEPICRLTHALESTFDCLRTERLVCSAAVIATAFRAADLLAGLIDDLAAGVNDDRELGPVIAALSALQMPTDASSPSAVRQPVVVKAIDTKTQPAVACKRQTEVADTTEQAPRAHLHGWLTSDVGIATILARIDCAGLAHYVALHNQQSAWILQLPMAELLREGRDLVVVYRELEQATELIELIPFQPCSDAFAAVDQHDYQVVALLLSERPLAVMVAGLALPPCTAWQLNPTARTAERMQLSAPAHASTENGGRENDSTENGTTSLPNHDRSSNKFTWMPSAEVMTEAHTRAAEIAGTVWLATAELRSDTRCGDLRGCLIISQLRRFGTVIASHPTLAQLEQGCPDLHACTVVVVGPAHEAALRAAMQVDEVLRCHVSVLAAPVPTPSTKDAMMIEAHATAQDIPTTTTAEIHAQESYRGHGEQQAPAATASEDANVNNTSAAHPASAVTAPAAAHTASSLIRVEASRLDHLLDATGELVVAKARIATLSERLTGALAAPALDDLDQGKASPRLLRWHADLAALRADAGHLNEALTGLQRIASGLQLGAMRLRMVQVGPLFQRFQRLIRDLGRDLGKDVCLVTSGDSTELDKKLVDDLVDPLTHLIRNAMDHGIEIIAERGLTGKPAQATVRLEAFQEGGQIGIRISDDGRGIDHQRIRNAAVAKGLISATAAAQLDEAGAVNLIFLPGFSTAATVTNVSGRGVGMDIVGSRIAELKGAITITTTKGHGTTFVIRLPLTLAMLDALVVEIGGECLAVPLDAVREIVEVDDADVRHVAGNRLMTLRGQVLMVIDGRRLNLVPHRTSNGRMRALIARTAGAPVAIPVDRVIGEAEVVIKPLPPEFAGVRGVAGATMLGDGGIALILDIPAAIAAACAITDAPVGSGTSGDAKRSENSQHAA